MHSLPSASANLSTLSSLVGLPSLKKTGGDSSNHPHSSNYYDHNNDELDNLYDFEGPTIAVNSKVSGNSGTGIGSSNNTFSPIKQDDDDWSKTTGGAHPSGGPLSPSPSKLLQFLEKNPASPVPPVWIRPPGALDE